jgi:4-amino-4-deoxy-L-arabinose transferase-like glycosyltransferase
MFALTATLTAVLFTLFAVRKFGVRAGSLSAALLAPTMVAPAYFGFSGNAEMFMVPLTVGALWLLNRSEDGAWKTDLLSGVLCSRWRR